jgi:hypothetical protein
MTRTLIHKHPFNTLQTPFNFNQPALQGTCIPFTYSAPFYERFHVFHVLTSIHKPVGFDVTPKFSLAHAPVKTVPVLKPAWPRVVVNEFMRRIIKRHHRYIMTGLHQAYLHRPPALD